MEHILNAAKDLFAQLESLNKTDKINMINLIRKELHNHSPFKDEPVDCVIWVESNNVKANDYNPNSVAPPEMELLKLSIIEDGYTQPIVGWYENGIYEVIDGFHRSRCGKEVGAIKKRVHGYLPVSVVNQERTSKENRMASTIRHNRARGKHSVDLMSEIVADLSKRNWNEEKIAKELGMEPDEVLRLKQITGLAELFADKEFSESWEIT